MSCLDRFPLLADRYRRPQRRLRRWRDQYPSPPVQSPSAIGGVPTSSSDYGRVVAIPLAAAVDHRDCGTVRSDQVAALCRRLIPDQPRRIRPWAESRVAAVIGCHDAGRRRRCQLLQRALQRRDRNTPDPSRLGQGPLGGATAVGRREHDRNVSGTTNADQRLTHARIIAMGRRTSREYRNGMMLPRLRGRSARHARVGSRLVPHDHQA